MTPEIRKNGFYWVKINSEWTIGEFRADTNAWTLIGTDESFSDEDLETVGPAIQKRDWFSFF